MVETLWDVQLYSLFSRASDVAETVQGKVKLGAAADDCRADLLVVSLPHELHPQDIRVGIPLRAKKKKGRKREFSRISSACLFRGVGLCVVDAHRPIEAVAVVVQLSSLLQEIKLDPVVET